HTGTKSIPTGRFRSCSQRTCWKLFDESDRRVDHPGFAAMIPSPGRCFSARNVSYESDSALAGDSDHADTGITMARCLFSILALFTGFAAKADITFHKDIQPLLQKNCQVCHRPGEAASMSLLTYNDVRPWAKAMRSAVIQKKMPPWFADG